MGQFVKPKVFLIGYPVYDLSGLEGYLKYKGKEDFLETWKAAKEQGLSDGECLCSLYAKLCYDSLVLGKNLNVSRIRDIPSNIQGAFDSGHGSVFEHAYLNFVVTDCSRVFTHELVRHRVGTAFSQTSGRYVRGDKIDVVFDPILEPVQTEAKVLVQKIEQYYNLMVKLLGLDQMKDFDKKKKMTSALRRFLPNGQTNEIGFSVNIRALRHLVQLRTSRHSEWEIRIVFEQIFKLLQTSFPLIFYRAKTRLVDGITEVYGMKQLPYELTPDDPEALKVFSQVQLQEELDRRIQESRT